jgi:hypothetical protein
MPIKDKTKYPKNWKKISDEIRFERAKGQCECEGECGLHHGRRCVEKHGDLARWANGKVILTVAHLNHNEKDSRRKNLKAMCQRCHLRYDSKHHAINSALTRKKKKAVGDLFES